MLYAKRAPGVIVRHLDPANGNYLGPYSSDRETDLSPFADEVRNVPDHPCPACGRREGAYEDGRCTPCGYVRPKH